MQLANDLSGGERVGRLAFRRNPRCVERAVCSTPGIARSRHGFCFLADRAGDHSVLAVETRWSRLRVVRRTLDTLTAHSCTQRDIRSMKGSFQRGVLAFPSMTSSCRRSLRVIAHRSYKTDDIPADACQEATLAVGGHFSTTQLWMTAFRPTRHRAPASAGLSEAYSMTFLSRFRLPGTQVGK